MDSGFVRQESIASRVRRAFRCIYLMMGEWNGRGVEVSVECDARQQVAAVAESLSSVAAGDLLGAEGGYGAGARFLESLLEGKEAVFEVSALDE